MFVKISQLHDELTAAAENPKKRKRQTKRVVVVFAMLLVVCFLSGGSGGLAVPKEKKEFPYLGHHWWTPVKIQRANFLI